MATPLRRTVVKVPNRPIRHQVQQGSGGLSFGAVFGAQGLLAGPRLVGTASRPTTAGTFPVSPHGEITRGD